MRVPSFSLSNGLLAVPFFSSTENWSFPGLVMNLQRKF